MSDTAPKTEVIEEPIGTLLNNPTFQAMLVVLKEESPVNYVPTTEGINPTSDLQGLGKIRGYHLALSNLDSFAKPLEQIEQLEATFASEKEEIDS